MKKQKFIIAGIVLLLIIIGMGYAAVNAKRGVNLEPANQGRIFTSQEYGLSVIVPEGWSYNTIQEKVYGEANLVLVVELTTKDRRISIPIFAENKSWDSALSDFRKNFIPEAIEEIILAGQPAVKLREIEKEINLGYTFRIKHPKKEDTVLLGTAVYIGGKDSTAFHNLVETVLNSIKFN